MIFKETKLQGAVIIELEMVIDERGAFARTFCRRDFESHGLNGSISQCSISLNTRKNTLRGMHYQRKPCAEAKLVRCSRGVFYDVIVDLRYDSATFKQWTSVEISAENRKMVYVPVDFAHGFQTLTDDTEVIYQMSQFYSPSHADGFRWNDPSFKIKWPSDNFVISSKDQNYPDFKT